jgi:diphthamide biosynthesis enzyme Dph1/Dph2-like protein
LNYLQQNHNDKFFFITGETSYSHCCADEVAALHLKAELIIRIGNPCLTPNKDLKVYFLCENIDITDDVFIINSLKQIINSKEINNNNDYDKIYYVFYDTKYSRSFNKIKNDEFIKENKNIKISSLPFAPIETQNNKSDSKLNLYSK